MAARHLLGEHPHLREIVRIVVCMLPFRRDDRLVHQLAVSSRKPIDELVPVPFPIGGSPLVFGVYPLAVDVDVSFVTDQPNPVLEGRACDRKRKVLDVAYVDEIVRIALEVRIDPVPSTEAFFRR